MRDKVDVKAGERDYQCFCDRMFFMVYYFTCTCLIRYSYFSFMLSSAVLTTSARNDAVTNWNFVLNENRFMQDHSMIIHRSTNEIIEEQHFKCIHAVSPE